MPERGFAHYLIFDFTEEFFMTPTDTPRSRLVTGLFPDRASAEQAYNDISDRGYGHEDVNLVMTDETRKRHFLAEGTPQTELGTKGRPKGPAGRGHRRGGGCDGGRHRRPSAHRSYCPEWALSSRGRWWQLWLVRARGWRYRRSDRRIGRCRHSRGARKAIRGGLEERRESSWA